MRYDLSSGNFEEDNDIIEKLYEHLIRYNPSWKTIYANSFMIFYVSEGLNSGSYGKSEGIGSTSRKVVVYADGLNDTTSAHELLHTVGLYHTFSNSGQLTLKQYDTDNIMDYSDFSSNPLPLPVVSTWKRQWKILKKHILIQNER